MAFLALGLFNARNVIPWVASLRYASLVTEVWSCRRKVRVCEAEGCHRFLRKETRLANACRHAVGNIRLRVPPK